MKKKRWQFPLILAVFALTIYNILPTIFYYCKPLKEPIDAVQAKKIATSIQERVDLLETESRNWVSSFCDLIHVKPLYISLSPENPQWISVSFAKSEEAHRFRTLFPRAGSLIPFVPAKLGLAPQEAASKEVLIQRLIPLKLDADSFVFAAKGDSTYREIIFDRASLLAKGLGVAPVFNHFEGVDRLALTSRHPLFSEISIDWKEEQIQLQLVTGQDPASQSVIDEVAKLTRLGNEKFESGENGFFIPFHQLTNATGFIGIKLDHLAEQQRFLLRNLLQSQWHPKHPDLVNMPIVDAQGYESLPLEQKAFCLLIAPSIAELKNPSQYVAIKGIERIFQNYQDHPDSDLAHQFRADLQKLIELLQSNGFFPSQAADSSVAGSWIFEAADFSRFLLAATREDFSVKGTQKYALLEVSDLEQRILTENKIDGKIHEDLLKWEDEYQAAQVSLNPATRFDVPKPIRSVFWNNLTLSARKLIRGDDRKILRWGLDLSGGKTVQIELRNANGELVTGDAEIKQGINELYNRVNKMGVSEVVIRQVGNNIVLDFPGSQALSAAELIKSSTMYFHVVNEKFSLQNGELAETTHRFLQEIWNHAVVSGKKDIASIQAIAYKHLDSEAGKILSSHGLKLNHPTDHTTSSFLDETYSKIAILRGNNPSEWNGQSHPLMIVFRNYALEGSQLNNIRAGYEPSKGNFLSFEILNSKDIFQWTSRYSKEKILGTQNEKYSRGNGWRMAVILNDTVINSPTLNEPLRDNALISGSFSQREVNQLAADLKAGSLTFTPHILSEKNVSPELGKSDRIQGIVATGVALLLVMVAMIGYYRFAGVVASVAVIFNLLILWATLQNLGATLSLAGIAGIILTVGMAVDANVLVFERIKEEFSHSGKLKSAIQAGYEKAYSAIIDSNVTTIIAALILLNFDAGPIKNFAVNLIIGIGSSMFTALFMTRFYFQRWIEKPKDRVLKMSNWIQATSFDFLKWAKPSLAIATVIILGGISLIAAKRAHIFGMDFTGGYSLYLEVEPTKDRAEISAVEHALIKAGLTQHDFQVRELNPKNHLRLLLGTSMEQPGKSFHSLPVGNEDGSNPRIEWVIQALKADGLSLTPKSLKTLDANWTAMSGQMSDSMRNNALFGLGIAFVCIFIYLAFRFEYKFAAAALICLLHDVLITMGFVGILFALKVPVQIDLNTIAAIMTIVGYSLNDTIIVFDRIREEMRLMHGKKMSDIVNIALNATLSRTTLTSGTTLLVLVALVVLGGSSIFSFALVMTIGVFFGTLSSWFIASPLMLFFHRREEKSFALNS